MKRLFSTLLTTLLFAVAGSAQDIPAPHGRLNDFVHLLTKAEAEEISGNLAMLESHTQIQFAVAIVPSLQGHSPEDLARKIGNKWGVGRKENNDGIVFLSAPNDRKFFIATGPGLTTRLPNATLEAIVQQKILPQFKAGRVGAGIAAGVRAIIYQLDRPAVSNTTTAAATAPGIAATKQTQPKAVAHVRPQQPPQNPVNDTDVVQTFVILIVTVIALSFLAATVWYAVTISTRRQECAQAINSCDELLAALRVAAPRTKEAISTATGLRGSSWLTKAKQDLAPWLEAETAPAVNTSLMSVRQRRLRIDLLRSSIGYSGKGLARTLSLLTQHKSEMLGALTRLKEIEEESIQAAALFADKEHHIDELQERIRILRTFQTDNKVTETTRDSIGRFLTATAVAMQEDGSTNWFAHLQDIVDRNRKAGQLIDSARKQAEMFDRAPAEAAKLMQELPAQIEKLEQMIRRSNGAKHELENARAKFAQANAHYAASSSSGLSGTDWFLIYMLLSNSHSSAQAASEKEASAVRAYEREQSDSSSSSSSSSGSGDFGGFGGGSFDGGGGAGGSY